MALENITPTTLISGYPLTMIINGTPMCSEFSNGIRNFIHVNHKTNSITFTLQNGPIREYGENGCQVDALIDAARIIIDKLNQKFPCKENDAVLFNLTAALQLLAQRRLDRENRGVEGLNLT